MTDTVAVALTGGRSLSPMQRALWASQLASPDSPVQNMALLSHFDQPIDTARLAEAFASVVAASDSLRTRIESADGMVGLIPPDELRPTEVVDVPLRYVDRWAADRAGRPLDMAEGGYDSAIAVHDDGSASWYLNLHHVITDATSSALVFAATASAYAGEEPDLDPYYGWARRLGSALERSGEARDHKATRRALDHWRARQDAPKVGRLYRPVTDPGPAAERRPLELGPELLALAAERLADDYRMLTDDLGWTTLLATTTALYCHRVTGADRFSLGLPVHNRNDPATRRLIGPTMEVFPVDVAIEPGDTYRAVHRRIGRSILRTLQHAVPGTSPQPDYEMVVNVIPRAGQDRFGSIPTTTRWIHPDAIDASHLLRVQMTSYVEPAGSGHGGPDARYEFAIDINHAAADPDHRHRASGHFTTVFDRLLTTPDAPIGATTICGVDELAALRTWEVGADPGTRPDRVVDRLEATLAGGSTVVLEEPGPDHTGSGATARTWTGDELWRWVGRIAGWMRANGVGPGDRVGIELPRSAEAVATIMASMRLDASFVPLDPTQPESRRRRLIERAGCQLVVTAEHDLHDLENRDATTSGGRPDGVGGEDAEAYLMFTSGSTGEPKGVPITAAGLAGYVQFALDAYASSEVNGGEPIVAPLFSALTFDLTITSLFVPILAGGRLVVFADDGPQALAAMAGRTELTWCKATPSHLQLLVRMLPDDHRLRTLVVGGEAFGTPLADELHRFNPEMAIFNEYGPTEAVVGCMIHRVEPGVSTDQAEVPIGRPAPGVTLVTVDEHLQRVPIGAQGELCIAHDGLTSGYLTADADSPFVAIDGRRFYRSGDLVRLQDPERMVYLGRIDEQVKVGGIRLEPVEVADALETHPLVERAAVRLWSPTPTTPAHHCARCGLPDNVPGAHFDEDGVCDTCHAFDRVAPVAGSWFKTPQDLDGVLDRARAKATGDYDCLHLLSGGKDSTYALYQLVAHGFRPYALTLDNGFISDGAKENVRRSVADLGVPHEFATSDAMNAIFRDSLARFSNVCHGCYKTIYTLATNRAAELGIPTIVTGLSRGQLFETRLIPQQFSIDRFDPDAIDRAVIEARKTYHRVDDGPNRLLDTEIFADDAVFDRIEYVDFYRYVDVELSEMLSFLTERAPWVRPADTGRSTNCLINAAGIHTHQTEQGYHNYAVPYAWDVRLGHKTRQEAIEELDDGLDRPDVSAEVADMLDRVGYRPAARQVLTAWVELSAEAGGREPTPAEFRSYLGDRLPAHAIPAAFVAVDALPLTTNGKLDTGALPAPRRVHREGAAMHLSPTTATERAVVGVWERILRLEPIGVDDDFFAIGGDSLAALEMIVSLSDAVDAHLGEDLAFLHPTPRALAAAVDEHLNAAGADRGALIDAGDAQRFATPAGEAPVAGPGELAMLFDQSNRPDDIMYNVGRLYRVPGPVDQPRFEAALRTVAARHQPLCWTHGTPRRHLRSEEAVEVRLGTAPVSESDLAGLAREVHLRPFDLPNGPLLRCLVQAIDDGTTAVVLAVHHSAGDAESFGRLWTQIDDELRGRARRESPLDYAGFVAHQQTDDDRHGQYWLDASGADEPAVSAIHRPPVPEPDGFVTRTARVTPDELQAGARSSRFAVVLAAVAATMRAHVDGPEVELGMITSTRDGAAADRLFGYLLNTLPVRVPCEPGTPPADVIERAAAAVGGALAHRSYPLARIRADRRAAGRPEPSTDVMVAFDDLSRVTLSGKAVDQSVLWNGQAVTDLTFFVEVRDNSIDLSLEHRGSVVGAAMAEAMLDRLDHELHRAVSRPETTDADLPAVGTVNGPPLTDDRLVIHRIADELRHADERPAVECGSATLTWAGLAERAAAVSGALRAAGVTPGDRVIVGLPRSVDLVAAIVGTQLAGAAYVPIDPTYPPERIELIVATAGAEVGLVTGDLADLMPTPIDPSTLPAAESTEPAPVAGDHGAYVIFTSGSTGRPRGVPVSHANLAASTNARADVYPHPPDRFLLLSSAAFDSSIVGLFWTLASGGTVVLPTDDEVHDIDRLRQLLRTGSISHTLLVPTLYQALVSHDRGDGDGWAAQVIVAGEACPPSLVAEHFERFPTSTLTNEYGPTEATVWATAHHCRPADDLAPIGPPIPGSWVAVVDESGALRPPGVAGELIIGGAGVVDGYLDDPTATDDRFGRLGPDDDRFFRTGDRAVIVDGVVHYLGRTDNQLNLGGARTEPEEIEAVLVAAPSVNAAVVTAVDTRPLDRLLADQPPEAVAEAMAAAAGEPDPAAGLLHRLRTNGRPDLRLVAHLEPEPGRSATDVNIELVRQYAGDALPALQRPAIYAVHDELPRTPNGKLDRTAAAALPIPDAAVTGDPSSRGTSLVDDALVERLTGLFGQILRDRAYAADHIFFDRGGHSLLAMELLLSIEEHTGRRVPAGMLYANPTPTRLAAALGAEPVPTTRSFLVPIQPEGERPPIFAVHVLGIDCAFFRPLAARLGSDQPMFGLGQPTADVELDADAPSDVYDIAAVYAAEIDRVAPTGPISLAAISLGGVVAYELAQQLVAAGRDVALLALFDALGPGIHRQRPSAGRKLSLHAERTRAVGWQHIAEQARFQALKVQRLAERARLKLRRGSADAADHDLEVRRFIEDNIRTQLHYRYEPYPGAMLVVKAMDDALAPHYLDIELGWTDVAAGGLTIETAPGGHLTMMEEPRLEQVAGAVERALAATADAPGRQPANPTTGIDHVERLIVGGLRTGTATSVVGKLAARHDLEPDAAAVVADAEQILTGLATATSAAGEQVVAALAAAGVDAELEAVPTRLQHASATVRVTEADVEEVTSAMAGLGFSVDDLIGPAARQAMVRSQGWIDYIRRDTATTRLRLDWGRDGDGPGRIARRLTPGRLDFQALDLPGWAWPAYWPLRPTRIARDRLLARLTDGPTANADLGLFLGTPAGLILPLLRFADAAPGELVTDIGCGDGRVLIEAARAMQCRGLGYEIDGSLAARARRNVAEAGLDHRIEIIEADAADADLGDSDVVFAFLPPDSVAGFLTPTLADLAPGARLLTHEQLGATWPDPPDRTGLVRSDTGADIGDGGLTVANVWYGRRRAQ